MLKKSLLAVAAVALSTAAQANGYLGVGAGASSIDLDCQGAFTCDDSGTAFKLLGGLHFTPLLAGELVYLNFGRARAADPGVSLDLEAHGVGGGIAFHVPLSPAWKLVARLGLMSVRAEGDARVGNAFGHRSESNTKAYGGVGIGYQLNPTMTLAADVDVSRAELVGEEADISAFTIGLRVRF